MIIDLTFTTRYYNPQVFLSHGVKHVKIKCPGQEVPSDRIYEEFEEHVQQFLAENGSCGRKKVIAVHCTHGINRTGYLVCRYLMKHERMDDTSALAAFEKSRGYAVEKNHYVTALHQIAAEKCQYSKKRRDFGQAFRPGSNKYVKRDDWVGKGRQSDVASSGDWSTQCGDFKLVDKKEAFERESRYSDDGRRNQLYYGRNSQSYYGRDGRSDYGKNSRNSSKFLLDTDRDSSRQSRSHKWSQSNRWHGERSHSDVYSRPSPVGRSKAYKDHSRRWAPY
ncbi:RNA/RNP complex-1-interacting phosphatase-like isoform X2 [Corticium candelabrum]|nr:RNA/RNP complex-1-interacting phosphatase-like isoform X2 [Corticium candelabrum]